ncbi:TonB-dependent receptor [Flavilitoribacter nigricans]|uniref:TonB-dependent receptor n=1 Tax=Flavilitoribacter nigricans (strain ATCC 23147 / DSM 23189 / NBRC 102662 / NCIMB 1420 / SS-2) TaxID=1122177 RepID=A0A2D0NDE1_FLAN2|nr:TonB-dependent receptor [Flavilitoribacter nigricans]PHN06531.1 TonB-dependent receptor [Flavilitoribacter nigricans DSM 23189 = NBRC 102662]
MKSIFTLLILAVGSLTALGQSAKVTGKITDTDGQALLGANVMVKGTANGAVSDMDGAYEMMIGAGTYTFIASYTGYSPSENTVRVEDGATVTLNFNLTPGNDLDVVVVSSSKKPEKLTESPATIETIFAREIEEYAGNPGELLARQKGIDYFRAGIATPAFNIRGFNSNFNSKNLQVTDGRFSTLVATGLPFGPLATVIKEDIERVEVILGPNATLYGPNAHNGLMNTITKDPRTSAGTTIALNPGVNGDGNAYYSARIRHAQVLSDKFAFKVMGEYTKATEFEFADSVYIDRVGAVDTLGNRVPDGTKEGYEELELDPGVDFLRAGLGLYYSPSKDLDVIFNTGYSNSNYLSPTNVGRNQIKDWMINYYQLRLSGKHWFAQAYYTISKTDSTYAIDQRTKNYYAMLDAGLPDAQARGSASYGNGALFQDDSRRLNAEAQYNNSFGSLDLIGGVQYQLDKANSLGSYLLDNGQSIDISQLGAYAHLTYNFGSGWRLLAAARADNHEIYDFNFVPKFGILKVGDRGTWRLTYGKGIAAPTILNMFGDLFAGLILGNAEGFTLTDGSKVEKQKVEKIQTIELGYRGQLVPNKFFLDANAYYNISKDFLSPVTVVGVATHRGDTPIDQVQSGYAFYNGLVATYVNFGEVNTYGFDLGGTYYFSSEFSANFNYSFFDYSVDEDNPENDFDKNGTVNFLDILVNAPTHKAGAGLNYSGSQWFGSVFGRWVDSYDYFSSFQIASRTHPGLTYRGVPIVENARSGDSYNYGPLGGFLTVDLSLGYRFNEIFTLSAAATNLFNQELREFTASAPTRGLYTVELKVNLPAIGKK